ncbi:MAG: HupE/UreJ family protein [Alphaproteobacteria bacterium]
MIPAAAAASAVLFATTAAFAHTGVGATTSFMAGLGHPLGGFDHILAMVAVGLWAASKGGKALWLWPCVFVGVMLLGGMLGIAGVSLPAIEPGIAASIVVLGTMVAVSANLPLWAGAGIVGLFALAHGHAHGTEAPEAGAALLYGAGFALATAALHAAGIGLALASRGKVWRTAVRAAGAAVALAGAALAFGA